MNEEQGLMQEGASPAPKEAIDSDPTKLPEEMQQKTALGAKALFDTSAQIMASDKAAAKLKKLVKSGKLTMATWTTLTQAIKIHQKQAIPVTPAMAIGAIPFIAGLFWTMGKKMGAPLKIEHLRKAVLESVDRAIGLYAGSNAMASDAKDLRAQRKKALTAAMEMAQQQGGQPGGPPPPGGAAPPGMPGGGGPQAASGPGGMAPGAAPAPQGGMM